MPYDFDGVWSPGTSQVSYTKAQRRQIEQLEADLCSHMGEAKPRRYRHSLSVALTAEQMALAYGVDPFEARVAGILHDWDKVLSSAEQVTSAERLGIDLGVDVQLVAPLLHGLTAARHLPDRYAMLPARVWQAIARHTTGHVDMSDLDMVLFVADGIEPYRADVAPIRKVRGMVDSHAPLADAYWASFCHGMAYVIETERYLYPGTLEIYNELALRRQDN